jgi:hypothetical protein
VQFRHLTQSLFWSSIIATEGFRIRASRYEATFGDDCEEVVYVFASLLPAPQTSSCKREQHFMTFWEHSKKNYDQEGKLEQKY